MQMNFPLTELTNPDIFLSAMLISVFAFDTNYHISAAPFLTPNQVYIACESLALKAVETPDSWAVKIRFCLLLLAWEHLVKPNLADNEMSLHPLN